MSDQPQTWHYGLVAQWWAEFNMAARPEELAYFQAFIERDGQPALDVGCGAGRLLLPLLRAGLDVDGCDISPDMLALWRAGQQIAQVDTAFPNDGLSIWHSIGPAAYQEVPHLHLHIHPRYHADHMLRVYPTSPPAPGRTILDQWAAQIRAYL